MKLLAFAVAFGMATAPASAAIVYTFASTDSAPLSFTLTTDNYITGYSFFTRAQLSQASGDFYAVQFCTHGTTCLTGTNGTAVYATDTIEFQVTSPGGSFTLPNGTVITIPATTIGRGFDFGSSAFVTSGNHGSLASAGPAALAVGNGSTVPEPASWALMVGGFGLVGSAMRRRRVNPRFA